MFGGFSPPLLPREVVIGQVPVFAGMELSGPGLRGGTTIVDTTVSYDVGPIKISAPVGSTQKGGTFTASWETIEGIDIVGTARGAAPDIGAWQRR